MSDFFDVAIKALERCRDCVRRFSHYHVPRLGGRPLSEPLLYERLLGADNRQFRTALADLNVSLNFIDKAIASQWPLLDEEARNDPICDQLRVRDPFGSPTIKLIKLSTLLTQTRKVQPDIGDPASPPTAPATPDDLA